MASPVRRRTRARELALQFLYLLELRGEEAMKELGPFLEHHAKRTPDRKGAKEVTEFAESLVRGVRGHLDELNQWIERIARNWRLERMANVDRNVLRMAIYELLHHPDVPFKVVINEAIDIAKRFSTSQSGAFVNGILDRARVLIEERRATEDTSTAAPTREEARGPGGGDPAAETPTPVPSPRPRPRKPAADGPG